MNALQFGESNSYSTTFSWALYMNQGSTPDTFMSTFTYDPYGNMTSFTDAEGNTTSFGYDTQHHAYLTSLTSVLNQTVTATYDLSTGRVTRRINPDLSEKEVVCNDSDNYVTIYDEWFLRDSGKWRRAKK